ncbi:hypothetical protein Mpal_1403 [Methanosphaerula palustris E1-9c]|uniref:Uncharacterized protein n=1 Tax=Methanosphaerula palustris (strain ATCC BAA-1556 / DSM 19958 / E1-9c) TaxID=521011 RepID=B8GHZ3_METPE|nr:hypothetical protein Mpal_1403 [Methanosphaerula palustris E1-9c]
MVMESTSPSKNDACKMMNIPSSKVPIADGSAYEETLVPFSSMFFIPPVDNHDFF